MDVPTLTEGKRGCGYRQPGGIYLVAPGPSFGCGKFPIPLDTCPHCGAGVKPSRAWTWFNPIVFLEQVICEAEERYCRGCPVSRPYAEGIQRSGLLWVGEKFYPSPGEFLSEAHAMGVSRRVPSVPRGFQVGRDWVFLAHRKVERACPSRRDHPAALCESCEGTGRVRLPAVFSVFRPTAIDYVVKGDETEAELAKLRRRGLRPVRVVHSTAEVQHDEPLP